MSNSALSPFANVSVGKQLYNKINNALWQFQHGMNKPLYIKQADREKLIKAIMEIVKEETHEENKV